MSVIKILPELLEGIGGINNSVEEAREVLERTLGAILAEEKLDAGWIRIHCAKGDIEVSAQAGEELALFCFNGLSAPGCICERALTTGQPVAASKFEEPFCTDERFKTALCVPAVMDGKPAGFIFLASREKVEIDATPLKRVADQMALMVSRLLHNAEMEKRLKTLQTVSRVGAIISSRLTLKELTQSVVEHLGEVLRTDRVNMVLYHHKEQKLEFIASYFSGEDKRDGPEIYPLSDGMNSWIIKNRGPLLIMEDSVSECAKKGIRHGGKPAKSWLGVPMIHNGKIIGILSVQSYSEPNLYDDASTELLDLVAGQVAVAVENARLYEGIARRELEKQKLYYSLTHDLLSFVTPISGYGEVIKRLSPDDMARKKEDLGDALLGSARKIQQFVEDILLFSKIQSGRLTMHPGAVNLYQIIDQSLSNFQSEMEMRKLDLYIDGERTHEGASRFPKKIVTCDSLQIERVLNNCIQNAVKHASSKVEVTTRDASEEVQCTISDDGDGMPKEYVDRVFDEYYQHDNKKKGVGLGLPSVKRIVEQHGGNVWVESDSGEGFAFTFTLPAVRNG